MKTVPICVSTSLSCALALLACSEGTPPGQDARRIRDRATRFEPFALQLRDALPLVRGEDVIQPRLSQGTPRIRTAHRLDVELPQLASGVTRISSGPVTLQVRAIGARRAAAEVAGRALVYRHAHARAHSVVVAQRTRLEEFILLEDEGAPRRFEYALEVTRGGGRIRQLAQNVEVLDAQGHAWIRMAPLYLLDADGQRHEVSGALTDGRLVLRVPAEVTRFPALLDPGWTTTGSMAVKRSGHTATRLNSGKVLVASGSTAELFDRPSGTWTQTGGMGASYKGHTATTLHNGQVLIVGGGASAALYDPTTGTWKATGQLQLGRQRHTATLLASGRVLVAGGGDSKWGRYPSPSTEIYDPSSGKWSPTGPLNIKRYGHTATRLATGAVLVLGGTGTWTSSSMTPLASAERYDPPTGVWTTVTPMNTARSGHTATMLSSGKILLAAGISRKGVMPYCTNSAELYDPKAGKWATTGDLLYLHCGQDTGQTRGHTATLLADGKVMVAGGHSTHYSGSGHVKVEQYDPAAGTWSALLSLNQPRRWHSATLLVPGGILVAGGSGLATAEILDQTSGKSCTKAGDCESGFCVDGICCDVTCQETCKKCEVTAGMGKCNYVAAGKADPFAAAPCTGQNACNGSGLCRLATGIFCSTGSQCVSTFCSDSTCCDSTCTGLCRACNLLGNQGKCTYVPSGQTDPTGAPSCSGVYACDGLGGCKKAKGQACVSAAECATNACSEGLCCDQACDATCMACNAIGSAGTCVPVAAGKQDYFAKTPCIGTSACDGAGKCVKGKGQACASSTQCVTGHCADGICCDAACTGTCQACNLLGNNGSCKAIAKGQPDATAITPCTGDKVCDGLGKCLTKQGKSCTSATDCLAGFCRDGVCCDKACDKPCESCSLAGSVGVCSFIPANTYSKDDCQGKDPKCGGLCNGAGKCDYPSLGTRCGTCKACDGTGQCASAPIDDKACGLIDCDKLDTACRDYRDLTADRCASLGQCKLPNAATSCTKYTDLQCDAGASDARQKQDQGTGPDINSAADARAAADLTAADLTTQPGPGEEGCNCKVGGVLSVVDGWPALLLAVGLSARRRRERAL